MVNVEGIPYHYPSIPHQSTSANGLLIAPDQALCNLLTLLTF
jgi:hypothetical protein